ncbi:unnamed protein product [Urochloa humidicola]
MASLRSETMPTDVAGVVLPMDVVYDILLLLQARPLSRFRAVCKSWRSLLSDDPRFAAAHAALHRRDPPLIAVCVAVGSRGDAAEIKLMDTTSGRVVKRLGTGPSPALLRQVRPHHGLVLLTHHLGEVLRVLDPATGATSLLPDDGGYYSSFVFARVGGDEDDEGEYKVLSLSSIPLVYKILTVDGGDGGGHGEWRDVPTEPPAVIRRFNSTKTAVAGGVVYHLVDNDGGWTMAAFDLAAEEWRPDLVQGPVAEPSIDDDNKCKRSLAEVNRRLAAVSTTESTMDVWLLMGGEGEEVLWWKRCRVLTTSIKRRHGLFADAEPLWVLDDGRVAVWVYSSRPSAPAGLWMYDPITETCTEMATMEKCMKIGVGVYTGNPLQLHASTAEYCLHT